MMKKLVSIAAIALCASGTAYAEEKEEMSKLDKALAKYERTGEMKRCINPTRIKNTTIVDENHIIFRITGKVSYLSTLPRRCHSLDFHEAIAYEVRGGTLCKRDIFHVIDSMSVPGPFCSFGEFEKIVKKPKDKS